MSQEKGGFSLLKKVSKKSLARPRDASRKRRRPPLEAILPRTAPNLLDKDDEIARLEKEFFEADEKPKSRKITKRQGASKLRKPPIPTFSCPSDSDEDNKEPLKQILLRKILATVSNHTPSKPVNISEQLAVLEKALGSPLQGASRIQAKQLLIQVIQKSLSANITKTNAWSTRRSAESSLSSTAKQATNIPKKSTRDAAALKKPNEEVDEAIPIAMWVRRPLQTLSDDELDEAPDVLEEKKSGTAAQDAAVKKTDEEAKVKPKVVRADKTLQVLSDDFDDQVEEPVASTTAGIVPRKTNDKINAIDSLYPKECVPKESSTKDPIDASANLESQGLFTRAAPARKGHQKVKVAKKPAARKRPKPATKSRRTGCKLCKDCPCTKVRHDVADVPEGLRARNMAAQERTLLRLMQISQKEADFHSSRADRFRRDTEKLRKEMWRKRGGLLAVAGGPRHRFLPDVIELDEHLNSRPLPLPAPLEEITRVQKATFGVTRDREQPTLTQLFVSIANAPTAVGQKDIIVVDTAKSGEIMEQEADGKEEHVALAEAGDADASVRAQEADTEDDRAAVESCFTLPNVVAPYYRVDSDSPHGTGLRSAWASFETSAFATTWDHLFEDAAETSDVGLENLIEAFEERLNKPGPDDVELSMLSQRGQVMASEFIRSWENDDTRHPMLNKIHPNWQENVRFAFAQQDQASIVQARERVLAEKAKMRAAHEKVLAMLTARSHELDMFDEVLCMSLTRTRTVQPDGEVTGTSPHRETIETMIPSSSFTTPFDSSPDNDLTEQKR